MFLSNACNEKNEEVLPEVASDKNFTIEDAKSWYLNTNSNLKSNGKNKNKKIKKIKWKEGKVAKKEKNSERKKTAIVPIEYETKPEAKYKGNTKSKEVNSYLVIVENELVYYLDFFGEDFDSGDFTGFTLSYNSLDYEQVPLRASFFKNGYVTSVTKNENARAADPGDVICIDWLTYDSSCFCYLYTYNCWTEEEANMQNWSNDFYPGLEAQYVDTGYNGYEEEAYNNSYNDNSNNFITAGPNSIAFDDETSLGGYDNTSYSQINQIEQPWQYINNVINTYDFVKHRKKTNGDDENCFVLAKEQIAKKGYSISKYNASGQTFQIYKQGLPNSSQLKAGISYIKYALSHGIPVIVGVDNRTGSPNPLTDNTTDHFVTVVGMGNSVTYGNYLMYYDNATSSQNEGTSPLNKLYYNSSTGIVSGTCNISGYAQYLDHDYIVTQIRKSK